jgi:hypothetical protein
MSRYSVRHDPRCFVVEVKDLLLPTGSRVSRMVRHTFAVDSPDILGPAGRIGLGLVDNSMEISVVTVR